jgi:hypothetical protein
MSDFHSSLREGVYLDPTAIPVVPLPDTQHSNGFLLNSYVLDFYLNGSLETLRLLNGINNGEAFQLLKEFLVTVQNINKVLPVNNQQPFRTLNLLAESFNKQFQRLIQ